MMVSTTEIKHEIAVSAVFLLCHSHLESYQKAQIYFFQKKTSLASSQSFHYTVCHLKCL